MDFGALPPEINSGRMYAGPGSGPMLSAAAAWGALAAELRSAAASYQSVISGLTAEYWRGPASASMAAAAAIPYVTWMNTTAAQAEQTAAQAMAAAGAYEAAFAMTVPPPLIAANRAQLAMLVATNFLGINTPAIVATEAHYAEMWAQDATAMYAYAGASAAASKVTPFTPPAQTTNPAGIAGQAAAVARATGTSAGTQQATLSQLVTAVPTALQSLSSPASSMSSTSGLSGILNSSGLDVFSPASATSTTGLAGALNGVFGDTALGHFLNANLWNTIFTSGFYTPASMLGPFTSFMGASAGVSAAENAVGSAMTGGLGPGALGSLGGLGGLGGAGSAVSAGLGHATSIGPLSVPPSWTAAAPPVTPLATALGDTPLSAPSAGTSGMTGIPLTGMAGNGITGAAPRYGFRPIVVARPPAAG